MSEDATGNEDDTTDAPVTHDDIMKRLLDYQRQLREGASTHGSPESLQPTMDHAATEAKTATATVTEEVVDLTRVEDDEPDEVIEIGGAAGTEVVAGSAQKPSEEVTEPGAPTEDASE